ncbi:hypothetical protein GCM10010094_54470 [Streptomyces flaveus]|uniref:Uncharacterized protein n=1 Tax=Streptomyces flaveus TaxID=66370 RepID=A0A917R413_9ACTN|nr:hypothetical protein GCM10010094_54470 [Streptomyces flaveus]
MPPSRTPLTEIVLETGSLPLGAGHWAAAFADDIKVLAKTAAPVRPNADTPPITACVRLSLRRWRARCCVSELMSRSLSGGERPCVSLVATR